MHSGSDRTKESKKERKTMSKKLMGKKKITWKSNKKTVAEVTSEGLVLAKNRERFLFLL